MAGDGGGPDEGLRPLFSIEAEAAVLGGLLLSGGDAWDRLGGMMAIEDFYSSDHRRIFSTIEALIRERRGVDVLTVSEQLRSAGDLERVGGVNYIHELAAATPSSANIVRYAEIVRERSMFRRLHAVAAQFAELARVADGNTAVQVLDLIQQKLAGVAMARTHGRGELRHIEEFITDTIQEIEQALKNREARGSSGISTGFTELDDKIGGGLKSGQLVVIAGRPGMGKSAIALNMLEDIAIRQRLAGGVFSMEMHATEIVKRQLGGMAKVHGLRLAHGRIDPKTWEDIGKAAPTLHQAPIYICEDGALSISEITTGARRLKRSSRSPIGIIVVDYLGLMRIERSTSNRAQDLAEISRGLKGLAKELEIPVILLAQLNREVEKRHDKRPVLSDLRDSGEIEADADLVLMLYREAVYREMEDEDPLKAKAEVLIRKQRNGPTGKVFLHYADWCTRFSDWRPGP